MNLRAAFLARQATVNPDGTFDVRGGGVTEFRLDRGWVLGSPIRIQFAVVLRLEMGEEELEQLRPVDLKIIFEGQQIGPTTSIPLLARRVPGETRYYQNVLLNSQVDVPRPGEGYLHITWDGGLTAVPRIYFRVGAIPSP